MTIRNYKDSDFEMLCSWWHESQQMAPGKSLIPETTYILEINEVPALSLSLFTTNVKGMCYFENFIGNPNLKAQRKEYSKQLMDYVENKAKELGFEQIVCFSTSNKVSEYYKKLGMKPTVYGLTSFSKEIK